MQLLNPFIDSFENEKFTFETRSNGKLFYVIVRQEMWILISTFVVANDKNDALSLLKQGLQFLFDAKEKRIKEIISSKFTSNRSSLVNKLENHLQTIKDMLLEKDFFKIVIEEPQLNQFFL